MAARRRASALVAVGRRRFQVLARLVDVADKKIGFGAGRKRPEIGSLHHRRIGKDTACYPCRLPLAPAEKSEARPVDRRVVVRPLLENALISGGGFKQRGAPGGAFELQRPVLQKPPLERQHIRIRRLVELPIAEEPHRALGRARPGKREHCKVPQPFAVREVLKIAGREVEGRDQLGLLHRLLDLGDCRRQSLLHRAAPRLSPDLTRVRALSQSGGKKNRRLKGGGKDGGRSSEGRTPSDASECAGIFRGSLCERSQARAARALSSRYRRRGGPPGPPASNPQSLHPRSRRRPGIRLSPRPSVPPPRPRRH